MTADSARHRTLAVTATIVCAAGRHVGGVLRPCIAAVWLARVALHRRRLGHRAGLALMVSTAGITAFPGAPTRALERTERCWAALGAPCRRALHGRGSSRPLKADVGRAVKILFTSTYRFDTIAIWVAFCVPDGGV